VNAEALVPAELAGHEVGDLREEEAPAGRESGDDEPEPELVAAEARPHDVERPGETEAAKRRRDTEACDGNLATDAEDGEHGDRLTRHAIGTQVQGHESSPAPLRARTAAAIGLTPQTASENYRRPLRRLDRSCLRKSFGRRRNARERARHVEHRDDADRTA